MHNPEIDGVAKAATSNLADCDMVIDELGTLAKGVDLSSIELKRADDRVARLLDLSEGLIELIADSGVETSDAPLIRIVIDTAKQISAAFESAIERGDIRLDQLMDERYREIRCGRRLRSIRRYAGPRSPPRCAIA